MPKPIQVNLPAELEVFVRDQIARGAAKDEEAFVLKALELYRQTKATYEDLNARVQRSLSEADRGEAQPLDSEATKAEARRRFADARDS